MKTLILSMSLLALNSPVLIAKATEKKADAKSAKVEKLVDLKASKVSYLGKKIGGEHAGDVKLKSGKLHFNGDNLEAGEFVIDMTTIDNSDISDAGYKKKFIDHMLAEDFFGVSKHPVSELKILKAKKLDTQKYSIEAELKIKGVAQKLNFDAVVAKNTASAKIVFDRTLFGIKYKSSKFDPGIADKAIYDDVQIDVNLVF